MASSPKTKEERVFMVHTIGGGEIKVNASRFDINKRLNQLQFFDATGRALKEWIFFLSRIAAVHPHESRSRYSEDEAESHTERSY